MSHLIYVPRTPFTFKDRYVQDFYVDEKRLDDVNKFAHEILVPMRPWNRVNKNYSHEAQVEELLFPQPFDLRAQVSYARRKELVRRAREI